MSAVKSKKVVFWVVFVIGMVLVVSIATGYFMINYWQKTYSNSIESSLDKS